MGSGLSAAVFGIPANPRTKDSLDAKMIHVPTKCEGPSDQDTSFSFLLSGLCALNGQELEHSEAIPLERAPGDNHSARATLVYCLVCWALGLRSYKKLRTVKGA